MTQAKRDLFKNIFLIIVGLLPILVLGNTDNWTLKIIQIIGILISGLNLILIFVNIQFFLDEIFPTKSFNEKSKRAFDNRVKTGTNIFFFISAIFMTIQIDKIDNTINGRILFWLTGIIGLVISIIVMLFLGRQSKTLYEDSERRYTILLGIPLAFFMFLPALASFLNRQFADKKIICKEFIVEQKGTDSRNRQCFVHLFIDEDSERFAIGRELYESITEGHTLELCTQNGLLGFEFVKQFKMPN